MEIKLEVPGFPPSKKNNRRIFKGKSLPSVNYLNWERMAVNHLKPQFSEPALSRVRFLRLKIEYPDKRRRDGDNALTSVLDMLVKANVLSDDNWEVVPRFSVECELNRDKKLGFTTIYMDI